MESRLESLWADKAYDELIDAFEGIRERWEDALLAHLDADGHFLLKYHPGLPMSNQVNNNQIAWVWTRIAWLAATAFAKLERYHAEANLIRMLVNQRLFCPQRRGRWWARLLLVAERYEKMPVNEIVQLCQIALDDNYVIGGRFEDIDDKYFRATESN